MCDKSINIISYHISYIIAEAERKLVPIFKEVLTNRKKDPLKCYHVYSFLVKQSHITTFAFKNSATLAIKKLV